MKGAALVMLMAVTGCASTLPTEVPESETPLATPTYLGIQTMRLADDLVTFRVGIDKPRAVSDINAYTDCAAAQYAQVRGMDFARRIRSMIDERGSAWVADAVYMVSAERPLGSRVIEVKTTLDGCKAQSIPGV